MNRKVVTFVQECVPKYRCGFYTELNKYYQTIVICDEQDLSGQKSEYCSKFTNVYRVIKNYEFLNTIWQFGLFKTEILKNTDIVVVNGNERIVTNLLLLLYCKMRRKKIVAWSHGRSFNTTKLKLSLRKMLFNYYSAICLYYENEIEYFKGMKAPIMSLGNGLDLEEIDEAIKKVRNSEITNNSEKKEFVFVYIGRPTQKARFDLLLSALIAIKRSQNHNFHLVALGVEKGDYLVPEELDGKITMAGKVYKEQKIAKYFLSADCFVYPGAVGLSLIHAQSYSLPVIVHSKRSKHMPEISSFVDNENGYSFLEGDYKSLAETMKKMMRTCKKERIKLGENGRKNVENKYNVKVMANNFCSLIDSMYTC